MNNFDLLIDGLDLRLFEKIKSQTSDGDKRSLLACQKALRGMVSEYTYLEIGSYRGGSIQPHLLDERCRKIYSIDKRISTQSDERGFDPIYESNTIPVMIENLKEVSTTGVSKLECIDSAVREIDPAAIIESPQVCFVDGEHTDEAAWRDFNFCLSVMPKDGALIFHDAPIIYNGLYRIIQFLVEQGFRFRAYNLPDALFVVELGDFPLHRSEDIGEMLVNNYVGYLYSLRHNDGFRRFANRRLFRYFGV